jgi:hypothetical protein
MARRVVASGGRVTPRLKAAIWVSAHLRVCAAQGITATVVCHGDDVAGSVLIKLSLLDGRARVLEPTFGRKGERVWRAVTGPEPVSESDADAAVARALKRDPDLWVIEIEDRLGRHALTDPVA